VSEHTSPVAGAPPPAFLRFPGLKDTGLPLAQLSFARGLVRRP